MQIELDIQEREVIKQYAKQMLVLFRKQINNGTNGNSIGADAMSLAFWERLATKMEMGLRPKTPWLKQGTGR